MDAPAENSTKPERVQLDHVLLDVDFLCKPKVVALRARHGHVSALYLIQILATLSNATNAEMDVYGAYGLGAMFEISIDNAKAIVEHCVKEKMLSLNGEILTQRRVAEDQEKLAARRKRDSDSSKAYRNRLRDTAHQTDASTDDSIENIITPVTVTDPVTGIESKDLKKNSKPKLTFPPSWGFATLEAFSEWQAYRKEIKKPLKNRSYQAQINQFANDPELFRNLVRRAISKGWQGLNEHVPFNSENTTGPPKPKQSNAEQTVDAVMEVLREIQNEA